MEGQYSHPAAIVTIVIAAITALLAYLLGRGSNAVRWLVGIVAGLEIAGSVYALARFAGTTRTNAIITFVSGVAVLYILSPSAEARSSFRPDGRTKRFRSNERPRNIARLASSASHRWDFHSARSETFSPKREPP